MSARFAPLGVRLKTEERAVLEAGASACGESIGAFVRRSALAAARASVLDGVEDKIAATAIEVK